jgi:hypothetical protein
VSFLDYLWDPGAWQARRVRKMREQGATECGFRVISGDQPGLSRSWRHGTARLHPGRIEFLPGAGMGFRIPRPGQPWLELEVLEVSRLGERMSTGSESFLVRGAAPIVSLTTPTAELEWVLLAEHRDWAIERVRLGG